MKYFKFDFYDAMILLIIIDILLFSLPIKEVYIISLLLEIVFILINVIFLSNKNDIH